MSPGRLLCVDDNKTLLNALPLLLEYRGFELIVAQGAAEALMKLSANKENVSAIITDHEMVEMGGLEFVCFVREMGFTGIIVIMYGNLSADEFREYQPFSISLFRESFDVDLLIEMLIKE